MAEIKTGGFSLFLHRLVETPVALYGSVLVSFLGWSFKGHIDIVIM